MSKEVVLAFLSAKEHIEKAEQYAVKAEEHLKSAGQYLLTARKQVAHGKWFVELNRHGIHPRKAQRALMSGVTVTTKVKT